VYVLLSWNVQALACIGAATPAALPAMNPLSPMPLTTRNMNLIRNGSQNRLLTPQQTITEAVEIASKPTPTPTPTLSAPMLAANSSLPVPSANITTRSPKKSPKKSPNKKSSVGAVSKLTTPAPFQFGSPLPVATASSSSSSSSASLKSPVRESNGVSPPNKRKRNDENAAPTTATDVRLFVIHL
jgi:hypothetical protein